MVWFGENRWRHCDEYRNDRFDKQVRHKDGVHMWIIWAGVYTHLLLHSSAKHTIIENRKVTTEEHRIALTEADWMLEVDKWERRAWKAVQISVITLIIFHFGCYIVGFCVGYFELDSIHDSSSSLAVDVDHSEF